MDDDETYQRLLGFGLNYISIRPRSEQEIRSYISKKINKWKISPELLEKVMTRLGELGYVDDLKFALAFIGSRNRSRPKGAILIRMELQKKGVDEDSIKSALTLLKQDGGGNEADLARNAAVKKLRSLRRYGKTEQRNKLFSFLMRRGFDHRAISSVIDELLPKGLQ
ncbi:MAG: regulatory protein RecX, regulatory protein [Microgenomates group bacterium GW2011_GWC1_43_11]|uniref:Regulatory protein RecX n=1 Tax=Candidatus Gottesmanbacteria bacterium GW2011_GWA1_44_24b TaxID=1618437 RepID=A0A0G1LG81_9BACT|nr:MAG: regulatory protein RecX, regulatory protein [Microgenomates group bacterium GW2011_GWC1_43_11]KKT59029.1 MAG: Regulatory protein RecX [Candidatus Gottesmanbacteria bacterium GW2011_GWA1_44_24b]